MVEKTFDLTFKKTKKRFLFRVLIDAPFIRLLLLQQKRIIWTICAKKGFVISDNTAVYIRIVSQCKSAEQKYGGVHENRFRANLLLTIVYDKLHFCWHILPRNPYKIWVNTIVRHSYFLWCCETENTFKPFLIYSDAKRKCIGVVNIHNNKMLLTIHRHIDNWKKRTNHFIVLFLFIHSLERLVDLAQRKKLLKSHFEFYNSE